MGLRTRCVTDHEGFWLGSHSRLGPAARASDLRGRPPRPALAKRQETARGWDLDGRGVLITGAAGGIGSAVARGFAAVGARLLLVDQDASALEHVRKSLDGTGHQVVASNLCQIDRHDALIERARNELGGLWALVHAAAVLRRRPNIDSITEEDWDAQIDTNLKTTFFLCRAAARVMIGQARGGRIITFASNAAWTGGSEGSVAYAASKGGVVSMTRGLARAYGPYGITVNAVAPGEVRTSMLLTGLSPGQYEAMEAQIPLGYIAEPTDIVGVCLFLASRHSAYITGAAINATGGMQFY